MIRAAGILFETPDGSILLLRRSMDSTQPGTWCTPGGSIEDDEDAETAARREAAEETGWEDTSVSLAPWTRVARDGVDFTTFHCKVPESFDVVLNSEHSEYQWVPKAELTNVRTDSGYRGELPNKLAEDILPEPIVTIYPDGEVRVRVPKAVGYRPGDYL